MQGREKMVPVEGLLARIDAIRKATGLSDAALSREMGRSFTCISMLRRARELRPVTAERYAAELDRLGAPAAPALETRKSGLRVLREGDLLRRL